jgi:hypothetical protein
VAGVSLALLVLALCGVVGLARSVGLRLTVRGDITSESPRNAFG